MRGEHPQKALRFGEWVLDLALHFLHVVRNVIQPQHPIPHGYAITCAATRSGGSSTRVAHCAQRVA